MGLRQRGSRIPELTKQFNLRTIVETGCHGGMGLQYAKEIGYDKFFSCDISEAMVASAKSSIPEAWIGHLDSLTFISHVLQQGLITDDRVLWFLDAHFPSMYDRPDLENETTRFPMIKEMELIRNSGRTGDVIVCDDIRCIEDTTNPAWRGMPAEHSSKEISFMQFQEFFNDTHICTIDTYDTGGAIFVPRK